MTATLGVDLAADPKRTALVRIEWAPGRALVTDARTDVTDDMVVELADGCDKVGIDCPLGWPDEFVAFVARHRDGLVEPTTESIHGRKPLAYRATDLDCQRRGMRPLSVSADRIAHAAFRCAGLLARLGTVDRSGAGRVVECYPAGSLRMWELPAQKYKDDPSTISASMEAISRTAGLTWTGATEAVCLGSDHAFDALVVALTARAAAIGRTAGPPRALDAQARREGWIHLPDSDVLPALTPA